jgi:hypothetical protein
LVPSGVTTVPPVTASVPSDPDRAVTEPHRG